MQLIFFSFFYQSMGNKLLSYDNSLFHIDCKKIDFLLYYNFNNIIIIVKEWKFINLKI